MVVVVKSGSDLMPPYSRYMEEREYAGSREKSYLPLWLILFGFSLGLLALWSREPYLVSSFMGIGYLGILAAVGRTVVASRDIFNPLCFIFFIGIVRYSSPALLLLAGVEPPEESARFYRLMSLSDSDWLWAHVLAVTSLTGIVLGWLLVQARESKTSPLYFSCPPGLSHTALLGIFIGLAALTVFILKNASLDAIVTGAIRNTEVQEGTGIYFRLTYMAIAGSILLSGYLLERAKPPTIALIPVCACTLMLLPLGGRGRAIIPLMSGLLLLWYRKREQKGWPSLRLRTKHVLFAFSVFLGGSWLFHFVGMYRGGYGIDALTQSLSLQSMRDYLQYSIFAEFGHLHSLAGAVAIGPGVLGGETFLGSLTFPLSKVIPIPGRSAGIYIIETLVGFHEEEGRWGLHASLMGDAYLNFGLFGTMIIMPLFGMLTKLLYVKFRTGTLHSALYAFAAIYIVNIFLKSIEAWPHMLAGLVFMLVLIRLAGFFNFARRAFT